MPKAHPAVRLEQKRANLKNLERKHRLLGTLIKKTKRSIAALERSAATAGPVPVAPPKEPVVRVKRLDDPILAKLQAAGDRAADALGVKRPKVRWVGTLGACKRLGRRTSAHVHTYDRRECIKGRKVTWSTKQKRMVETPPKFHTFRRGDVCVSRKGFDGADLDQDDFDGLMAHEVSHLKHKRTKRQLNHGKTFDRVMSQALEGMGRADLVARNGHHYPCPEFEAAGRAAELLDDVLAGNIDSDEAQATAQQERALEA